MDQKLEYWNLCFIVYTLHTGIHFWFSQLFSFITEPEGRHKYWTMCNLWCMCYKGLWCDNYKWWLYTVGYRCMMIWSVIVGDWLQLCYQNAICRVPTHLSWLKSNWRVSRHLLHKRRRQVFSEWWSWNRYLCWSRLNTVLLMRCWW